MANHHLKRQIQMCCDSNKYRGRSAAASSAKANCVSLLALVNRFFSKTLSEASVYLGASGDLRAETHTL